MAELREARRGDEAAPPQFEPVELTYAALLFEYVDLPSALATLRRICAVGGVLATRFPV